MLRDRSAPDSSQAIDVARFLGARPIGRFRIQVALLAAAAPFIEGVDTQAIGDAGDWHGLGARPRAGRRDRGTTGPRSAPLP